MYDLHCHIAFGLDDGAQTIDEAVAMVELASQRGTQGIVATPHCNIPGSFTNYWSNEILKRIKTLRDELDKNFIDVRIFCGQEIFCTSKTVDLLDSGELITLNNSRYPLVEFDFYDYSDNVYEKLDSLRAGGYIPVVAHPERYAFVQNESDAVRRIKRMGCLLQLNKGSLEGRFGPDAMETATEILDAGLADVIASDAHSPYVRTPNMIHTHEFISEEYSFDYADLLLEVNPGRILRDKDTFTY